VSGMIEKLTYINERGESLIFSSRSIYHTNIKHDVLGLADIQNEVFSISSHNQDGNTYVGGRIAVRDIEIVGNIKEREKTVVQNHRRNMTRILNPKLAAILVYEFGTFKRVISCRANNPAFIRKEMFEQFTIPLACLNPFWRDENETRNDIAVWVGGFEFLEPDGLEICDDEGWEIGYREPSLIVNVYNGGDASTGLRADFRALGVVLNPLILNVTTGEFIKINFSMIAGDVLTVNTGYGQKVVTLKRAGITTDAFRFLDIDSTYLQLEAGDNLFRYDAADNVENLEVSIYHNNQYLGV